jgi:hypothetical protein
MGFNEKQLGVLLEEGVMTTVKSLIDRQLDDITSKIAG